MFCWEKKTRAGAPDLGQQEDNLGCEVGCRVGHAGQRARTERKAVPSACCSSSWFPVPPFIGHCAVPQPVHK